LYPVFWLAEWPRGSRKKPIDSSLPLRVNDGEHLEKYAAMFSNFTGKPLRRQGNEPM
jgi:hypothetical protein